MELQDIIQPENLVFSKTENLTETPLSYCPGCGHGVVHRLIMEIVEELAMTEDTIGVSPVGCSVLAYDFMNIDVQGAAHGRAAAVATGIKRVLPAKLVFTYQGDGDAAAIGTGETIHACNRGENITIIFINNGIYGMTGGQMSPTTLEGMRASTSPYGREINSMGHPLKMAELVAGLPGVSYVSRHAVHKAGLVRNTKKAIRKAFGYQLQNRGTTFIEIVANCNAGWKMSPTQSNEWLDENMLSFYPLGDIVDRY